VDDIGLYFSKREFHLPTWHPRKNSAARAYKKFSYPMIYRSSFAGRRDGAIRITKMREL
jgi:hypothetical protein